MSPEPLLGPECEARRRPSWRRLLVRLALLVAAVVLAAVALRGQWEQVGERARDLSVAGIGGALLLALASLAASATAFRQSLVALGHRLPLGVAARIYLVGQLGKYLPGSVWPVLAQMEMGAEVGVPRARAAGAALLALGAGVVSAVPLAVLAAPPLLDRLEAPVALVAVGGVALAASLALLHPRVLGLLIRVLLRAARRPLPTTRLAGSDVLRVAAATLVAAVLAGLSVAVLAVDLGAREWILLPLAVAGYAAASVAGLLVVPVPAGAGVREAVLVLALLSVMTLPAATVLAATTRLVFTLADLLASGLAVVTERSHHNR